MQDALDQFLHELFEKHFATLWKRAFRIIGDGKRAEDIVQDVFLIAAEKAGQLALHPNPAAWLHKVLHNRLYHELRKSVVEEISVGEDIESFAREESANGAVFSLPETLSAADKEILLLRYEHKLSYGEISDCLGISLSAVKMRLQRAKQRYKENL